MKKKYIAIACTIGIVWIGAIGFLAIKSKDKPNDIGTEEGIERYVIPEDKKIFLNGVVQPKQSKVFYKDVTKGEDYKINKKNGDYVSKGSLLITYTNESVKDQISELQDQVNNLKKEKNKVNNNPEVQALEGQEMATQSIQDQIKDLEKEISKLKKKQYSCEYAPFAGKVYISNKVVGEENQELLKLRSDDFYIKSQVSERDLDNVKEDQPVDVLVLANDKKVKGTIGDISYEPESQVASLGEEVSGASSVSTYPVTIELKSQDDVVNGYHVQAKLKLGNKELKIPKTAVKKDGDSQYVYLIEDNKLKKQTIKTKGTKGENIVVISGLKEKDEIVEVIGDNIEEGQEVE